MKSVFPSNEMFNRRDDNFLFSKYQVVDVMAPLTHIGHLNINNLDSFKHMGLESKPGLIFFFSGGWGWGDLLSIKGFSEMCFGDHKW